MYLKSEALDDEDDISSEKAKEDLIESCLEATPPNVERLRQMCVLPRGILTNRLRKKVWPAILGVTEEDLSQAQPTDEELRTHRDYNIVELDVQRLLKRYPPDLSEEERLNLETSLKRIIMRTIFGTNYHYYQGFHDIAITIHLVLVDEDLSVAVLKRLCQSHFHVFMMPTLVETSEMLQFIYPLIDRCDPDLHDFLLRSNIGTMFALPWLITWYGHNIQENVPYNLVVRLCDLFIATDQHMPIYLGAAIVASLTDQIFAQPEDQAEVHGFLNRCLNTSMPWETLINEALDLYLQYPPASIASEAATYRDRPDVDRPGKQRGGATTSRTTKVNKATEDNFKWWMTAGLVVSVAVVVIAVGVAKFYRVSLPADENKTSNS